MQYALPQRHNNTSSGTRKHVIHSAEQARKLPVVSCSPAVHLMLVYQSRHQSKTGLKACISRIPDISPLYTSCGHTHPKQLQMMHVAKSARLALLLLFVYADSGPNSVRTALIANEQYVSSHTAGKNCAIQTLNTQPEGLPVITAAISKS